LNYTLIDSLQLNLREVKETIINSLNKEEGITYVIDMEGTQNMFIPAPLREKIIKGYNSRHSGAIQIIADPQQHAGTPRSPGTTHGVWSPYDSHIPLVFMGWGIKQGVSNKEVHVVDIAPTLSSLLHIMEPNGNIGKPIVEVLG